MYISPIKSIDDHKSALARIEALWDAEPGTEQGDELDVLATLVDIFEAEHFPIEAPDPIEAIKFRMEQLGLSDTDLVPFFGHRSKVSEIMNRKRRLNITMIRKLHAGLKIPLDCLINEYPLAG
jgi:HTH-type transcriptional regulator/antitoxin HigA